MPELIATVSRALDLVEKLREISSKVRDAETKNVIADLRLALADLKDEIADLQEENRRLREELEQAKAPEEFRNKLEKRGDVYWFQDPAPEGRDPGPYCTSCVEDGRLTLLASLPNIMKTIGKYKCPKCETVFQGE